MAFALLNQKKQQSGHERSLSGNWTGASVTTGVVTCNFTPLQVVAIATSATAPTYSISGNVVTLTFASGDGGSFQISGV